ncbi:PQQ-dependent sugar dehydrogenase [Shewanella saliphila]
MQYSRFRSYFNLGGKFACAGLMLLGLLPTSSVFAAQSVMITVTKGFGLSLFASDLGDIKQMTLGDDGTLFVGSQKSGTVYALVDSDQNGQVDKRYLIARGLEYPEALAFHDGALYVTEEDRIIRFEEIESRLRRPGRAREVYSNLPSLDKKYSRAMRFGPDDRLYVSIGSPCNVCEAASPFSSILAIDVDSGASEQIALGLRSVTGFDWSPETNKLWFADLGRNWMGDNIPADEINRVELKGSHYGFPYLHGSDVVEPAYDKPKNLNVIVPEFELPAHVAPTGLSFYRGEQFPERYRNQIFVAENGSWNRSSKVGYQIVMLEIEDDKVNKRETVVSFLDGEFPVARPFDVINAPDGSMYISDDLKGNIYRLFYNTAEQSQESN